MPLGVFKLLSVFFIFSFPFLLLTTNLNFIANFFPFYKYEFDKYDVPESMGIEREEVLRIARELIGYFNSPEEWFREPIFNEKEIVHLRDIKGLIRFNTSVQKGIFAYSFTFILLGFILLRKGFLPLFLRSAVWGSGLALFLMFLLGFGVLFFFDPLFYYFHVVGFGDPYYWMLDPAKDKLILMFPPGFFFDAGIFIALATILEAFLLGGFALWGLRTIRGQRRLKRG